MPCECPTLSTPVLSKAAVANYLSKDLFYPTCDKNARNYDNNSLLGFVRLWASLNPKLKPA